MGARTAAYAGPSGSCSASARIDDSSAPRPCNSTTSGDFGSLDPAVTTTGAAKLIWRFLDLVLDRPAVRTPGQGTRCVCNAGRMIPVTAKKIAYQGEPGANSDIAVRDVFPDG